MIKTLPELNDDNICLDYKYAANFKATEVWVNLIQVSPFSLGVLFFHVFPGRYAWL
jgi:hypothetical protein